MLAFFLGIVISLGLFGSMQAMINNNQQPMSNSKPLQMTEFIKLKKLNKEIESKREIPQEEPPPPPQQRQKPIEQKPLPEMEIPELDIPQPELLTSSDVQLAVVKKLKPKPKEKPKVKIQPTTTAPKIISPVTTVKPVKQPVKVVVNKPVKVAPPKMSNKVYSNVRPTYQVPPKYPRRALSRKQKGWVKVQFIITASGKVKSPFVVSSKPSGVFDKAALKAIRRWKFKAKIVNGQAVAQRAVQTIKFKLR
jgi:protein TonB